MKTTNNKYVAPVAEMIELNAQAAILEGSGADGYTGQFTYDNPGRP
jgi:hypothetical protein